MAYDSFTSFIYISRTVVNLIGIIGNIISFIVFCRPVFRKNSISVYCCALAIFDCFTLNQLIMDINILFDYFPPNYSDIICKVFYYITIAFSGIPAWILVAFSIDKILSMKNSKFVFFKKRSFQIGIIAVFAIANILIFSEILVFLKRVPIYPNNSIDLMCDLTYMPYISIVVGLYLLEASLIPFVIMFCSSVFIVRLLVQSRRRIIGDGNNASVQNRKGKEFKFAVISLTFNCLFITLKLPLAMFYILSSIGILMPYSYINLATLLFFINSSISFLVHFISNSIFRKELGIIIKIVLLIPVDHLQLLSTTNRSVRRTNSTNREAL